LPVSSSLLSAAHSKSAEEGRNEKKYPTDEGDDGRLVKIMKKGDTYKPEKLEASIKAAGASSEVAKKVVNSFKVHEGMSTLELRKQVSDLLKNLDPKAARNYDAFKKK
jgi:hypothetical protein